MPQTLEWSCKFDAAIYNAANPHDFTDVTAGQIVGGNPDGPVFSGGSGSGSVPAWTSAAQYAAGYDAFSGYKTLPAATATYGMVSCFFRIKPTIQQGAPGNWVATLFTILNSAGSSEYFPVGLQYGNGVCHLFAPYADSATGVGAGSPPTVTGLPVNYDTWFLAYVRWQYVAGTATYELGVVTGSTANGALPSIVGTRSAGGAAPGRVLFPYASPYVNTSRPGFCGGIARAAIYSGTTYASLAGGPTDFTWPAVTRTTRTIKTSGGTYSTWAAAIADCDAGIIRGQYDRNLRYTADSSRADLEWVGSANANRIAWGQDVTDGLIDVTGDTVSVDAGNWDVGTDGIPYHPIRGVRFKGPSGHTAILRYSEALAGAWTQTDAGSYPTVWQYDGANRVGRDCYFDCNNASGPYRFYCVAAANLTDAKNLLRGGDWRIWVNPSTGKTYVSLPAGMSPTDYGVIRGWSGAIDFPGQGCYFGPFTIKQACAYKYGQLDGDVCQGNGPLMIVPDGTASIIDLKVYDAPKHNWSFPQADSTGMVWADTQTSYNPPRLIAPYVGAPNGSYTVTALDQTNVGTEATPGSLTYFFNSLGATTNYAAVPGTPGGSRVWDTSDPFLTAHGGETGGNYQYGIQLVYALNSGTGVPTASTFRTFDTNYLIQTWQDGTTPTTPITANLTWSLPVDRTAGTAAALAAVRSRVQVGEETDVRLVFAAAGTAALAADLTGYTLEAEIASSTSADPLATAPTVTVNSATQFEVAFTAASASGITPGTYVLSAYRTGSGLRTELARVVVVVTATAFAP